jgi:hypothetical protein
MTKKKFDQKSSHKDIQALGEASSPTENSLNIKVLNFFLYQEDKASLDLDPRTHLNLDPSFVEFASFCRIRIQSRPI